MARGRRPGRSALGRRALVWRRLQQGLAEIGRQPRQIEFDLYGKDDPRNAIGAGLADSEIGLRLRYEIRREFAPYAGIVWTRSYGKTEDFARAAGHDTDDLQFVAGLRLWF